MSKKSSEDFDVIDDEEMLNAIVAESKAKTLVVMENGLKAYLKIMGKKGTFKGWVAHDYPENVTLDSRLNIPYNDWELVWNKITGEYSAQKRGLFSSFLTAKGIKTRRKLVRKKSGSKKRRNRKYRKQSRKARKARKSRKSRKSRKARK